MTQLLLAPQLGGRGGHRSSGAAVGDTPRRTDTAARRASLSKLVAYWLLVPSLTVFLVQLNPVVTGLLIRVPAASSRRRTEFDFSLVTFVTFAIVRLSAGFVRTDNKDSAVTDTSRVTTTHPSGALIMKLPLC